MNAATLEAALPALAVEAIYGLSASGQVYVGDRQRVDGKTIELQFLPLRTEEAAATGWGVPSRLHRYRGILRTSAGTRADHRRMWGEFCARVHGRRAPLVAGLEVAEVGDVTFGEQDGVGDATASLSSSAEITFKGDVLQGEMASSG